MDRQILLYSDLRNKMSSLQGGTTMSISPINTSFIQSFDVENQSKSLSPLYTSDNPVGPSDDDFPVPPSPPPSSKGTTVKILELSPVPTYALNTSRQSSVSKEVITDLKPTDSSCPPQALRRIKQTSSNLAQAGACSNQQSPLTIINDCISTTLINHVSSETLQEHVKSEWHKGDCITLKEFIKVAYGTKCILSEEALDVALQYTIDPDIITFCLDKNASIRNQTINLALRTGCGKKIINRLVNKVIEELLLAASGELNLVEKWNRLSLPLTPETLKTAIIYNHDITIIKRFIQLINCSENTFSLICERYQIDVEWAKELMEFNATITQDVLDNALKFQNDPETSPAFFHWLLPQTTHLEHKIDPALLGQTNTQFLLLLLKLGFTPSSNSIRIADISNLEPAVIAQLNIHPFQVPNSESFLKILKNASEDLQNAQLDKILSGGKGASITQEVLDNALEFQKDQSFIKDIIAKSGKLERKLDLALIGQQSSEFLLWLIDQGFKPSPKSIEIACLHAADPKIVQRLITLGVHVTKETRNIVSEQSLEILENARDSSISQSEWNQLQIRLIAYSDILRTAFQMNAQFQNDEKPLIDVPDHVPCCVDEAISDDEKSLTDVPDHVPCYADEAISDDESHSNVHNRDLDATDDGHERTSLSPLTVSILQRELHQHFGNPPKTTE